MAIRKVKLFKEVTSHIMQVSGITLDTLLPSFTLLNEG